MRLGLGLGLGMLQTGGFNPAAVNSLSWGASYLAWGDSFLVWGTGDPDPAPTFVSGTVGPTATTFTLVFSEPVTWPGADPRGLVIEVPDGNAGGAIVGAGLDWEFAYVSGKGTNTITVSGDGGVASGYSVFGYFNNPTFATEQPGNITDLVGNALTPFGHAAVTNNVP